MKIIIDEPKNIEKNVMVQLANLIEEGEQVQRRFIDRGLASASLVALIIENDEIITSATVKNPLSPYRNRVFRSAGVESRKGDFQHELGYVVTNPRYSGQGRCQRLLKEFMEKIDDKTMFATTRKPSMVHILKKIGFEKLGGSYNKDLELFVFNNSD